MAIPGLSLIVPFYDERDNLPQLAAELARALCGLDAEILVVDDGSTDGGGEAIRACPGLVYIAIPHGGKSAALRAGLARARAPLVATIDADLQEDPAAIRHMAERIADGYDCVSAVRSPRRDPLWRKRVPSRAYALLIGLLFGRWFRDIGCGLRVCRRDRLERIPWFDGAHRLVPLLIARDGGRILEVPVAHSPRRAGRSKYRSVTRLLPALRDLLALRFQAPLPPPERLPRPSRG